MFEGATLLAIYNMVVALVTNTGIGPLLLTPAIAGVAMQINRMVKRSAK